MNKCSIVKDLFTSYISGVGSEDTRSLVDEHIKTCADCKSELTRIQNRVATTLHENDSKSVNVFRTMKKKIFRRNVIVAAVTGIVVLFLALNVGVKITKEYRVAYSEGLVRVSVNYAEYYKNEDGISVVITDPSESPSNSVDVNSNNPLTTGRMAVLDITHSQQYSIGGTGRTIIRDGEKVRVEYIYCTQSNLSKMRTDNSNNEQVFRFAHTDLTSDNNIRTEVYYLTDPKVREVSMSDKEYDDYRHQGTLVWSGIVE